MDPKAVPEVAKVLFATKYTVVVVVTVICFTPVALPPSAEVLSPTIANCVSVPSVGMVADVVEMPQ